MADVGPIAGPPPGRGGHGRGDLTTGPIGRTLLAFALPTLASNILQSLNGSINSIFVGRFLGENALAATSNANLVMFLMFSAVFGFGMAATVLIGQNIGRGNIIEARRVLATPPDALPLALDYLRVVYLTVPGAFMLVLLMMGLRGMGDAKQ